MRYVLLETLGRFSKTNLPMLLLDSMSDAAEQIWILGERQNCIELFADEVQIRDIASYAQGFPNGILLRLVERFDDAEQEQLARLLIKMQSSERGKFILTANNFDVLHEDLLKSICKINFCFPFDLSSGNSDKYAVQEIGKYYL